MNELVEGRWSVIARSASPGHWHYTAGWAWESVDKATREDTYVVMHRKTPHGWELVAQLAGPTWKRWQRRGKAARAAA